MRDVKTYSQCQAPRKPLKNRVRTGHGKPGKSWNFISQGWTESHGISLFRAGKSWNFIFQGWKVMEFNCWSMKVMEN